MHTYQPQWPEDDSDWGPPCPADLQFCDARDIASYASLDSLTTWYTYPHVWHLDGDGRWHCYVKGSSIDSLRRFAEAPDYMLECRLVSAGQPCPDYWVVLEPRHRWNPDCYEVTEGDAQAFVLLRRGLARHGVTLLDVVVFDENYHWWSLHELTSGSTKWNFGPEPRRRAPRPRARRR